MIRSVLVTGAAGFLGRLLCARLHADGIRVRAADRIDAAGPWDELVRADLTDPSAVEKLCDGVDTVFHLAAKTHATGSSARDLADYQTLNVDLTGHLLDEAARAGVQRFLFTSSVKVIGEGRHRPQTEADPPLPESAYGRTKLEAEQLVHETGRGGRMHTTVLRMPLIYGPGVKGNLDSMLRAIARSRFPALPDTGNRRSLVDVRDVAAALVLCAGNPVAAGRTYVVTDGRWYSTHEMAALIRAALGMPAPRWAIPAAWLGFAARVGDGLGRLGLPVPFDGTVHHKLLGSACFDSTAIERELGFKPEYDLESALPDIVQELRQVGR